MAKQVERSVKVEKWGSVGHSWVKVPNLPQHKARAKQLTAELGDPAITYHDETGRLIASQWRVR